MSIVVVSGRKPPAVSAEVRRLAVRAVCANVVDAEEAALLLEVLDLHPWEGR